MVRCILLVGALVGAYNKRTFVRYFWCDLVLIYIFKISALVIFIRFGGEKKLNLFQDRERSRHNMTDQRVRKTIKACG